MSKTKWDSCSWVPMMRALQGTWLATRVYALTPFFKPKYLLPCLALMVGTCVSMRWPSLLEC